MHILYVYKAIVSYLRTFKYVLNHQKEMNIPFETRPNRFSSIQSRDTNTLHVNRGTPLAFPHACATFICMYALNFTFATHIYTKAKARNRRKSNNSYIVVLCAIIYIRKYKTSQILIISFLCVLGGKQKCK